jgi:hypothetical protein
MIHDAALPDSAARNNGARACAINGNGLTHAVWPATFSNSGSRPMKTASIRIDDDVKTSWDELAEARGLDRQRLMRERSSKSWRNWKTSTS